jgi:hypothetical protein
MPFAYYQRLSARDKKVYLQSEALTTLRLPRAAELWPIVAELERALASGDRLQAARAADALCRRMTAMLGAPPVAVEVLAVRPTLRSAELHGLYTYGPSRPPRIRVWMRTVHYRRVVAFRTFLRTLLHELCHHLDYAHLKLADSFHTEGFFKRESSLFRQLVPGTPAASARGRRDAAGGG